MATLLAKENIRDVLYRYCRAADRGDLALLKSCYHPDSLDDHGFFKGSGWDFADYVLTVLSEIELSIHSISNPLIELHGKKAYVEHKSPLCIESSVQDNLLTYGTKGVTWTNSKNARAHGKYCVVYSFWMLSALSIQPTFIP